jgi:hypothetical protein
MGNETMDFSVFPYNGHDWEATGHSNTVKSIQNSQLAVCERVKKLDVEEWRGLALRALHRDCLVGVLAVLPQQPGDGSDGERWESCGCALQALPGRSSSGGYTIVIERISYRLSDLGAISYHDGLYVLRQGLKAIKIFCGVYENFQIE